MLDILKYLDIQFVDAQNLPDAWYQLQKRLWETDAHEYPVEHGSYPGQLRREFDFAACRIRHPEQRPLCETMMPARCDFPPTTTPENIEKYFNNYILNTIVPEETYYTYGSRIVPQVVEIIRRFKTWGFRHAKASITVADPHDIYRLRTPDDPDSRASEPCLREITFKARWHEDLQAWKMHMYIYFRVWDLFGGLPENLGGLQLLNEFVVNEIDSAEPLSTGEMIIMSPSLNIREHIFDLSNAYVG